MKWSLPSDERWNWTFWINCRIPLFEVKKSLFEQYPQQNLVIVLSIISDYNDNWLFCIILALGKVLEVTKIFCGQTVPIEWFIVLDIIKFDLTLVKEYSDVKEDQTRKKKKNVQFSDCFQVKLICKFNFSILGIIAIVL